MNYWLLKSEPSSWSWDDQKRDKVTFWDGVRNYQAANNMKAMKIGDLAFFYHSVKEKQIVGIVKVVKEYYPDPSDKKGIFGMVDVEAVCDVIKPVTLAQMKSNKKLEGLALIRQARLSVCPVSKEHWQIICEMAGI